MLSLRSTTGFSVGPIGTLVMYLASLGKIKHTLLPLCWALWCILQAKMVNLAG